MKAVIVVSIQRQSGRVWILDNLQLVLLVRIEKTVECGRRHVERFSDQGGESSGERGNLADIAFIDGAESGEKRGIWPLVRAEEVAVEGGTEGGERVRGGYVNLLAP